MLPARPTLAESSLRWETMTASASIIDLNCFSIAVTRVSMPWCGKEQAQE